VGEIMNLKIDNIMQTRLITIQESEGLESAYLKMKKNGIRHLPVLDAFNNVVGIISDRDVQRSMMSFENGSFDFNPDEIIANYMSSDIISVPHDSELLQAVQKMIDHQISAVLITEKSSLVGIITHEDLLLILADLLRPKEGVVTTVQNWLFKTPVGEIAEKFAAAGI
jgi:acetoin utilization protein AcuB